MDEVIALAYQMIALSHICRGKLNPRNYDVVPIYWAHTIFSRIVAVPLEVLNETVTTLD